MSVNGSTPLPNPTPPSKGNAFDGEAIGLVLFAAGIFLSLTLFLPISPDQPVESRGLMESLRTWLVGSLSWGSSLLPLIPFSYGVASFSGNGFTHLNRWLLSSVIIVVAMLGAHEILQPNSGGSLVQSAIMPLRQTLGQAMLYVTLIIPIFAIFIGAEIALQLPFLYISKLLFRTISQFISQIGYGISKLIEKSQIYQEHRNMRIATHRNIKRHERNLKLIKGIYPSDELILNQEAEIRGTRRNLKHQDERGLESVNSDVKGWEIALQRHVNDIRISLCKDISKETPIDGTALSDLNQKIRTGMHTLGNALPNNDVSRATSELEKIRRKIGQDLEQVQYNLEEVNQDRVRSSDALSEEVSLSVLIAELRFHKERAAKTQKIVEDLHNAKFLTESYSGWPILTGKFDSLADESGSTKLAEALRENSNTLANKHKWEKYYQAILQGTPNTEPPYTDIPLQQNITPEVPMFDLEFEDTTDDLMSHASEDSKDLKNRTNPAVTMATPMSLTPDLDIQWEDPELIDPSPVATPILPQPSQTARAGISKRTAPTLSQSFSQPPSPSHNLRTDEPSPTPTRRRRNTKKLAVPPLALLDPVPSRALSTTQMDVDARERAQLIEDTLKTFKLQAKVVHFSRGPTVTRYEIEPASGEKVTSFSSLSNDLARALAVGGVRIEAPVAGKNVVGLEVPNVEREPVTFHQAASSKEFRETQAILPIILGKAIDGEMEVNDLSKMPHILIAGSTGSGKSVCINALINSLLYHHLPYNLRFLMIDPKRVELTPYNGIPHLIRPVIPDPVEAAGVLLGAVTHMERRYKMLSEAGTKNLEQYNKKMEEEGKETLPYLVIIIDELADLMMSSPKEVELATMRLAQMARATGMHLILATQRPSVDILTSLIKVNVPARVAFAVSSSHDSRTILDTLGAERLAGQGDMLFHRPGLVKPIRLQGPYINESEIQRIVTELKRQTFEDRFVEQYGSDFDNVVESKNRADNRTNKDKMDFSDPLLRDAALICVQEGQGAISRLQRNLQIGYSRAGHLMDMLEAMGIVGKSRGSKAREVLISEADLPEYFGK